MTAKTRLKNWDGKRSTAAKFLQQCARKPGRIPLLNIIGFGSRSKGFSKDFSKAVRKDPPSRILAPLIAIFAIPGALERLLDK